MRPDLRFRLIANLGSGSHARVQLAHDRLRRMDVAIKRMHHPDAEGLFRLKQEFRAARDLSHPNLVQVYELIESGGDCLFTMEPVFGVDLAGFARERLTAAGLAAALRPISHALLQLLAAMQAVHEAGMVHRDIKPSNVLVGASGRVVLLDFGLAAPLPEELWSSDRGQLVGTVAYLAPECLWGGPPTVASDWYALGAVMAELVLGAPLFSGSVQALLRQKDRPPVCLADRLPGLPPALDRLICGLLALHPERRPDAEQIAGGAGDAGRSGLGAAARAAAGRRPRCAGGAGDGAGLSAATSSSRRSCGCAETTPRPRRRWPGSCSGGWCRRRWCCGGAAIRASSCVSACWTRWSTS